jgi:hypothetical protein
LDLKKLNVVSSSGALSQKQYDFRRRTRKQLLLEEDERDVPKASKKKATDIPRVVGSQKLGWEHKSQSTRRLHEGGSVYSERSPRRSKPRQSDSLSQRSLKSGPARLAGEILIADIRRVADDGVIKGRRNFLEKVPNGDVSPAARFSHKGPRSAGTRPMNFETIENE